MTTKIPFAVADLETDPFKYGRDPQPFAAGFFNGETYQYFWSKNCADQLADYIQDKKIVIYAHNGGKFDWFLMFHRINPDKKFQLLNGRIAKAYIGQAELRDSFMILPIPLALHGKDKIDYKIMEEDERNKPENKKKILSYLKTDCISLYGWVDKFCSRFGRKFTIAGAAFDQLHKTGYDTKNKTGLRYDNEFRPYYFGGRCEAIKKGFHSGKYKIYDINSAYPFAMLANHPFGSETKPLTDFGSKNPYFARIECVSNGALPFRDDTRKIIYFNDNKRREYNVTGWEIRAGIETKTLHDIELIEGFEHLETENFREYVHKFYAEKLKYKNIDHDNYWFAKLMLNSAYGKFGQNSNEFRKYKLTLEGFLPLTKDDEKERKKLNMNSSEYMNLLGWTMEGHLNFGLTLWSCPDPQDTFFNVATAASITGYVRAYIWRAICKSKDPIYCDTDSIICKNFEGELGTDLGQWECEGKTWEGVYIGGRKLYTTKLDTGKIKKAHKGARLSHEEIIRIVKNGETIEWIKDAPSFSVKYGVRFMKRKLSMT